MPVEPPKPRYTVEDLEDTLQFTIPSRKYWFILIFIPFWLIMWAIAEVMVAGILIGGLVGALNGTIDRPGLIFPAIFLVVWLSAWTVGGFLVVYAFLWQLVGKEILEVSPQSVTVRRRILGFNRSKEYLAEHISGLRVTPLPTTAFGIRANGFWGMTAGPLTFDYGAKTFRVASGAEEAEAKQIIAAIQQRFPQYRRE